MLTVIRAKKPDQFYYDGADNPYGGEDEGKRGDDYLTEWFLAYR